MKPEIDYMKYYVSGGMIDKEDNPVYCHSFLYKKKVIIDGKKKIRKRFLPIKQYYFKGRKKIFMPTLELKMKIKYNDYAYSKLQKFIEKRIDLHGFKCYGRTFGWYQQGKPISKDWILPEK